MVRSVAYVPFTLGHDHAIVSEVGVLQPFVSNKVKTLLRVLQSCEGAVVAVRDAAKAAALRYAVAFCGAKAEIKTFEAIGADTTVVVAFDVMPIDLVTCLHSAALWVLFDTALSDSRILEEYTAMEFPLAEPTPSPFLRSSTNKAQVHSAERKPRLVKSNQVQASAPKPREKGPSKEVPASQKVDTSKESLHVSRLYAHHFPPSISSRRWKAEPSRSDHVFYVTLIQVSPELDAWCHEGLSPDTSFRFKSGTGFAILTKDAIALDNTKRFPFELFLPSLETASLGFVEFDEPCIMNEKEMQLLSEFQDSFFDMALRVGGDQTRVSLGMQAPKKYLLAPVHVEHAGTEETSWELNWDVVVDVLFPSSDYNLLCTSFLEKLGLSDPQEEALDIAIQLLHLKSDGCWVPDVSSEASRCSILNAALRDLILLTKHNHSYYHGLQVCFDKTAQTPFPKRKEQVLTFFEYFSTKYNLKITNPHQFLVELKNEKIPNLLIPFEQDRKNTDPFTSFLLPELLDAVQASVRWVRAARALPSILYRFESVVFAQELRLYMPIPHGIETSTIIEALTFPGTGDVLNYERLETLGDSFLKYATGVDAFLANLGMSEAGLTQSRMEKVGNRYLFDIALRYHLEQLVLSHAFNPKQWYPPGCAPFLLLHCVSQEEVDAQRKEYLPEAYDRQFSTKQLADVVEAIIGASYRECGHDAALKLLHDIGTVSTSQFKRPKAIPVDVEHTWNANPKGYVLEYCSRKHRVKPKSVCEQIGTSHAPEFTAVVSVQLTKDDDETYTFESCGSGATKKKAERAAYSSICAEIDRLEGLAEAVAPSTANISIIESNAIDVVEGIFKHAFQDPALALQALRPKMHAVNQGRKSYERLEFLGDAVLDWIITERVVDQFPTLGPGDITEIRMMLVSNRMIGHVAVHLGLHEALAEMYPSMYNELKAPIDASVQHGYEIRKLLSLGSPKVMADMLEAFVGAIYLDMNCDYIRTRSYILPVFYWLFDLLETKADDLSLTLHNNTTI